jgi:hypothetical protein
MKLNLDLRGQSTNLPNLKDCENCSAYKFACGRSGNPATARDRQMAFDGYRQKRDPRRKLGPYLAQDEERMMRTNKDGFADENREVSKSPFERLQLLIAKNLAGAELDAANLALEHLLHDLDQSGEDEAKEDGDEEERRAMRRRALTYFADFLAEKNNMSEDEIAKELQDFPRNGLGEDECTEQLDHLMRDRRAKGRAHDRRVAMDGVKRREAAEDYYARFPGAKRIGLGDPTRSMPDDPFATVSDVQVQHRPLAMDSGWDDFHERFPGAARIGTV